MSSVRDNSSFLPLMAVTLCFMYLSESTQIWLHLPLYGSHMWDQSVEKYPSNLLDQSLLSNRPYASGMPTTTILMHFWTRQSWDSRMIMSHCSPMAGTNVLSSWMILTDVSLHRALILLAMESGMTLATTLESTK